MTGRHLGERIHDLLDNRLPRAAATEAMAHLAECDECAQRWRELRTAREALHSSDAGIDMTFARRLLDRDRMAEIAQQETRRDARAASGRDRRPAVLVLSLSFVLAALVGAAYVAGEPADVEPDLSASSEDGVLSVAQLDSSVTRTADPRGDWIHPDWQSSGLSPVGAKIREASDGSPVLVATLLVDTTSVTLAEMQGRLNSDRVAGMPLAAVDGVDAYVVDTAPAKIVWQAGVHVVYLECDCALGTLEMVATQFPQDDEPGFVDQVMAGFGVFADALTGN